MKKILWIALLLIVVGAIISMPWIVDKIFYTEPPADFFYTHYEVSDILSYYASVLSLLGTAILGILTLRQNKIAQEKSEEVNRLQLELQRKSMAMAEAQYKKDEDDNSLPPKFEITLKGYSGTYCNMRLEIKNVSSIIASSISPISLVATNVDNQKIASAKELKIDARSLSSAQAAMIESVFPELVLREGTGYGAKIQYLNDIKLLFEFSCEDELSKVYYFRATATLATTKDYYKNIWEIERVG
ncbi:MAG: hypothetical protein IKK01_03830 [Clostridia bacterium]|nr:hypothetical protein [Clostridia bacterium]